MRTIKLLLDVMECILLFCVGHVMDARGPIAGWRAWGLLFLFVFAVNGRASINEKERQLRNGGLR